MLAEYVSCDSRQIIVCLEGEENEHDATLENIVAALANAIDFCVYDVSEPYCFGNDCYGYELEIEDDVYVVNSTDVTILRKRDNVVLEPQE